MYMLASDATYGQYKIVGRKFIPRENTDVINQANGTTLKAFGTKGYLHLLSTQNEVVRIYDGKGQLVCEERTEPETILLLQLPMGLYLVSGEKDNIKVRVE